MQKIYDNDLINITAIKKKIFIIQILRNYGEVKQFVTIPPDVDWIIHHDNQILDFLFGAEHLKVSLDTCEVNYAILKCNVIAIPMSTLSLSFLKDLAYGLALSGKLIESLGSIQATNDIKSFEAYLQAVVTEYEGKLLAVRNPNPIGKRITFNTRKGAYEAAKGSGNGNEPRGPEDHGHGPHYHPNVPRGNPKYHDHYYFPKRFF